jgi:hypothetical protein
LVISDIPRPGPPGGNARPASKDNSAKGTFQLTAAAAPRPDIPAVYWDGLIVFKDARMNTGVAWEKMSGVISTKGLYENEVLGPVTANIAIDKAELMKQPIETLSARLVVDPKKPNVVQVPTIKGSIYGGEVGGEARFLLGEVPQFRLSLNGTRMKMEEIAKVNKLGPKTQLEGLATAKLELSNEIDPQTGRPLLQGAGEFDIPQGKLLDLPVILDVIKLTKLRPMDRTMFEEAHAVFRIRGNRIKFGQLDLIGNALSLSGTGDMNLDGKGAEFEFYTIWTNIRNISALGGDVMSRISSNLYKIKVTGDLGEQKPKVSQEPLPVIMEPVKRLMNRLTR